LFEFAELRFRPIEKDDLKLLHVWENDFETMMYSRSEPLNTVSMSQFEEKYAEMMKNPEKNINFVVENTTLKEPIGTAGIHRETSWNNVPAAHIGTYIGKKECWEKGLGTKITVALLEMSFIHLGLQGCQAWSVEFNTRAHRTLEACGFKKCGAMRDVVFVAGKKWDMFIFDILREEYMNTRMNLLKKTLGDSVQDYLKKNGPALKPAK
jgi:RimJ/RimL family protein N-acetyltransferase